MYEAIGLIRKLPFSVPSAGTDRRSAILTAVNAQTLPLVRRAAVRLVLLIGALCLFAASVWWDNAANRGIAPPPTPPIPFADVPRGGVNTYNLHGEVVFLPDGSIDPNNKVKRTFEMIAAADLHWVRVQFPWEDIEICDKGDFVDHCRAASNGASAWNKYDYIVQEAERNGLELLVRLDRPPTWARKQFLETTQVQAAETAGREVSGPPDKLEDYGDFVAAVAARYRAQLRFYQIWNEPNLPGEWNYHREDPAQLVQLLRIARERLTAADPDAVIVFPALSPTDGRGDGMNDLDYLQGVYDAGGRELFDIMSAQLYGLGQPPTEHRYVKPGNSILQPIDTKADVGRVVLLREIMVRNGDERKAVWVSELGWNSAPPELPHSWGASVSEETKAEYLVQAMQRAEREWPWMGAMCIWMFRWGGLPPDPANPTPYFQLVNFNFEPLPAYNAVGEYLRSGTELAPAQQNLLAAAATGLSAALVLLSSMWLFPALAAVLSSVEYNTWARRDTFGQRTERLRQATRRYTTVLVLTLQATSLLIFYLGSTQVPLTALGALGFLALALFRPDLALIFVPLTVPLYLAPKGLWDERFGLVRAEGYFIPLHEVVLWCVVVGTAFALLRHIVRRRQFGGLQNIDWSRRSAVWPALLLFVAATIGVFVAPARGAALREWRWLIVEPLIFYGLVHYWALGSNERQRLMWAWMLAGIGVALIGLLQLTGVDVTALLPQSNCFSDRVVLAEGGLQRISSVYCHPNNLGLALGRVWPVWAALALAGIGGLSSRRSRWWRGALLLGAALCVAALFASFSKGAMLGVFVALIVLGELVRRRGGRAGTVLLVLAAFGAFGVLVLGIVLGIERLNPLGGSSEARLELWTSALAMMREHPLTGVGLDQFYHYRTAPEYGDRYIDPAARTTNEQFASHPHTVVLDLLVRMGPLGLLAVGWLIVHFFQRSAALLHHDTRQTALVIGLSAGMSAALVHGLVDNFYFVPDLAFSFWLMLGLVEALPDSTIHQQQHQRALMDEPIHV